MNYGKQSDFFSNDQQVTTGLERAALLPMDHTIPQGYINYLFFESLNNYKSGKYHMMHLLKSDLIICAL